MSSSRIVDPFASSPESEGSSNRPRKDTPASASKCPDRQVEKPKFPTASFEDPDEWVYFDVGPAPNAKRRQIHKEAIYIHCTTFRKAFESNMKEGQTKVFKLGETNMKTFVLFQQWVYSQSFNLGQLAEDYEPENMTDAERDAENQTLAELWVFGDTYIIPVLQNYAMTAMIDIHRAHRRLPSTELFDYIYENTMENSALRTHVVQLCVLSGRTDIYDDFEDFQPAMFADICKRFAVIMRCGIFPWGFGDITIDECYVDE
ncbi:hypothetical protein ACEPPN_001564 [Leptodophora sp. 'Broadleaf-Isolate-01']